MTLYTSDAKLEVFKPTNTSTTPDTTVTDDLEGFDSSSRIQELVDTGNITIHNPAGTYTDAITSGDRVKFYVNRESDSSLTHIWTGMVRNLEYQAIGGRVPKDSKLVLEVDDYVFGILDTRNVVNAFQSRQVSGTSSSILNILLDDEATEIDQSLIETISTTTSISFNSVKLLDAVKELADRVNAVVWADGTSLGFKRKSDVATQFTMASSDHGLPSVREKDDFLANVVRVEGGDATAVDDQQTTQSAYSTVTSSTRLVRQFRTRKSEVAIVELWTRKTGSGEGVKVRLQKDLDGEPEDVTDHQSDLASRTLASDFLSADDYTTFLLPDHTLPEADPWLIIESDGATGQDIGVDGSGVPAYKAHFPYRIAIITEDQDSIDEYGRRERTIRRESLNTRTDAQDFAAAVLEHSKEPDREITVPAESQRAHLLKPGEGVAFSLADYNASGSFIVTDRSDIYDGATLETTLTAQEVATI